MMRKLQLLLAVLAILSLVSSTVLADGQTGFEEWFGHNYEPVGGSIMGLSFATTAETDVLFADINAKIPAGYDWYSMTSDNGKVSGDGEYFISGDMAAYCLDGDMKISITGSLKATQITIGISSFFDVIVEAYDIDNNIISGAGSVGVVSAPANTKTRPEGNPATGMQYITVSCPKADIAYVLLRSEPGYYVVDNISYVVPEPMSILALVGGFAGLAGVAARRRRK